MERSESVASLVAAAREGDSDAWDALVERYLPLVMAIIARHRLFGADADDVNQTVWLRLVEHLGQLREPEALPGWIATTTRHECLRALRTGARVVPVDPQAASPLDRVVEIVDLEDEIVAAQRHQALRDALGRLPAPRRELILLLLADPPVPYGEISRRLGIPVGSIGPTRARALEQLRRSPELRVLAATETIGMGR